MPLPITPTVFTVLTKACTSAVSRLPDPSSIIALTSAHIRNTSRGGHLRAVRVGDHPAQPCPCPRGGYCRRRPHGRGRAALGPARAVPLLVVAPGPGPLRSSSTSSDA